MSDSGNVHFSFAAARTKLNGVIESIKSSVSASFDNDLDDDEGTRASALSRFRRRTTQGRGTPTEAHPICASSSCIGSDHAGAGVPSIPQQMNSSSSTTTAATVAVENMFRAMFGSCTGAAPPPTTAGWGEPHSPNSRSGSGSGRKSRSSRSGRSLGGSSSDRRSRKAAAPLGSVTTEMADRDAEAYYAKYFGNQSSDPHVQAVRAVEHLREVDDQQRFREARSGSGGSSRRRGTPGRERRDGAAPHRMAVAVAAQGPGTTPERAVPLGSTIPAAPLSPSMLSEDGTLMTYDDGISAISAQTLEEMAKRDKVLRMQQRQMMAEQEAQRKREEQEAAGDGSAEDDGGPVNRSQLSQEGFDITMVSTVSESSLFPPTSPLDKESPAEGAAGKGCQVQVEVDVPPPPPAAETENEVDENGDRLGVALSPFDLSRGRSTNTWGSKNNNLQRIGRSFGTDSTSQSTQTTEFESDWKKDEAKYWNDVVQEEEKGAQDEDDVHNKENKVNKSVIPIIAAPPQSPSNSTIIERARKLRNAQSKSNMNVSSYSQQKLKPTLAKNEGLSLNGTVSLSTGSSAVVTPSGNSNDDNDPFDPFVVQHHPHDTLNLSTNDFAMSSSSSVTCTSKKSKRKKSRRSRLRTSMGRMGGRKNNERSPSNPSRVLLEPEIVEI